MTEVLGNSLLSVGCTACTWIFRNNSNERLFHRCSCNFGELWNITNESYGVSGDSLYSHRSSFTSPR